MDARQILEAVFGVLMAVLAFNATRAISILDGLKDSVEELNLKIAVVIEKVSNHEKRLDVHDEEIRNIKSKED